MNLYPFRSSFTYVLLINLLTTLLVLSLSEGSAVSAKNRHRNGTAVESGGGGGGGGRRNGGGRRKGNNGNRNNVRERNGERPRRHRHSDLSLWIDEKQVKMFSGKTFVSTLCIK